ncbi:MAG: HAD family hydrolase [Candidatus Sumerlaeaceae bacterium]
MTTSHDFPNPLGLKLVVFDLDGTLVDAFADIAAAVNHMLALDGQPPRTVEEVKKHVGRGVRRLVAGVLGTEDETVLNEKVQVLTDYYRRYPVRETSLYDGVAEALDQLDKAGLRLAVASNKPDALTRYILEHFGVAEHFDWIVGQSDAFPRKPAPDILHHLMANAEAQPNETVLVGDSETDIEFAHNAGVRVVCATYGQRTRDELLALGPDAMVDSMHEFVARLAEGSLFS